MYRHPEVAKPLKDLFTHRILRSAQDDDILLFIYIFMAVFIDLQKEKREHFVFDKKEKYVIFMYNASGKFIFEMKKAGVEVVIYGLFVGKQQDNFAVETIQHHAAPGSVSDLFIKGVFDGESRFNYQGLIRIEKEGQKSHAYQKNQNLILSPKAFVESKPYLEILANDVFCTHGSTTGKLNKDEIFYIKSRGIDEQKARQMLVEGFIQDITTRIRQHIPDFSAPVIAYS